MDTQSIYTFNINPLKGDSVYKFEIYLIDSLEKEIQILSNAVIQVSIDSLEIEIFYIDEFGKKMIFIS